MSKTPLHKVPFHCNTSGHQRKPQALVLLKCWLLQQGRAGHAYEWPMPRCAMQKLQQLGCTLDQVKGGGGVGGEGAHVRGGWGMGVGG